MDSTGTITMSMRELDRFKVIQAVAEARLKPGRAAERLALTTRQVRHPSTRLVRARRIGGSTDDARNPQQRLALAGR